MFSGSPREPSTVSLAVAPVLWICGIIALTFLGEPFSGNRTIMAAMAPGSFIAGASAAGGGAVAFPVLTLVLGVAPSHARDFSMYIQSAGMTCASLLIVFRRIPVDWRSLRPAFAFGLAGLLAGDRFVLPVLDARRAKLAFGTIWFTFALALLMANAVRGSHRERTVHVSSPGEYLLLCATALAGGVLTACFGSGADLAFFSVIVLYFGVCEKVATPTSVVLMAMLSMAGSTLRLLYGPPFPDTVAMWKACVPVVLVGAPLGAWVCARLARRSVAGLLVAVLVTQFAGTLFVLSPGKNEISTIAAAAIAGACFFRIIGRLGDTRLTPVPGNAA